jgi:hypothetical protein
MRNILMPTKRYRQGLASTLRVPRRVRLAAYAIAFGLGLAMSFLLVRNAAHPPAPQGRASESVSRHTVASAPQSTVTAARPPASPPIGTPPLAGTGRVRPLPDTFEDATSSLHAPYPDTVSAHGSRPPARRAAAHSTQPPPSGIASTHDSRPSAVTTTATPAIPAHQATVPKTSSDFAQTDPSPAVPEAEPPSSSAVNPALDTPAAGTVIRQAPEQIQGTLTAVSVDTWGFTVRGITGTQEFRVSPQTVIYAGSERIEFSRMPKFVGTLTTVWSAVVESDRLAGRVVLLVYPSVGSVSRAGNGGNVGQLDGAGGGNGISSGGGGGGSGGGNGGGGGGNGGGGRRH